MEDLHSHTRDNIRYQPSAKKQVKELARYRFRGTLRNLASRTSVAEERKQSKSIFARRTERSRLNHRNNLEERRTQQKSGAVWPGIGRHAGTSSNRRRGK